MHAHTYKCIHAHWPNNISALKTHITPRLCSNGLGSGISNINTFRLFTNAQVGLNCYYENSILTMSPLKSRLKKELKDKQ